MNKLPLRKNDVVIVRSGKDKGKTGKILKVIPEEKRVVVEKINFVNKAAELDKR